MVHRRTLVIGALTVSLICSVVRAQNAVTDGDAETIQYAPVPEFWSAVERALPTANDLEKLSRQEREKLVPRAELLGKLAKVSLPQTAGLRRVRVYPEPTFPKHSLLGFLIHEGPDKWTVFTSNWRVERVARKQHTKIELSDLSQEIDTAIEFAGKLQRDNPPARDFAELPAAIKDGHNHFNRPRFLFDLAYLAFASGRMDAVEPLLRAVFHEYADLTLNNLFRDLAWQQFEVAVLDLNQGAGRAELSRRFQRIADDFPNGKYEQQATEYARKLKQMAAEDAEHKGPPSVTALPIGDRVKELTFQLRNCNAVQSSQPGTCWIPSMFQPVEEVDGSANAADQLIELGFEAIPALIEALNDDRLTRSYGFHRDFDPWRHVLEVRDAAIQSLVVIADHEGGRRLYHNNSTSGYFSNDTPEARTAVVARVEQWWAEAKSKGEAEWLRERLRNPGQSRPMLMRRLIAIEHEKAVPDVRKWIAEEKYSRTYAYQLLIRAGGDTVIGQVQRVADPANAEFDFGALFALKREQRIVPTEYKARLLNGAELAAKRDSGKLSGLVLMALTETGDRKCTLFVAERLRGGKFTYGREMGWALAKVNDPEIAVEVAAYLLPFFDITETGPETGYRQDYLGKPDLYRVKDDAAFAVNHLLGEPFAYFGDITPPERDEQIEKLRALCKERGIRPAFSFSE